MSSDNTRIVKNSIILYIRLVITSVVGLFVSRLVLQNLGASDFGLYSVVGGIVILINVLSTAMTSASYRFIAFEMGKGNTAGINKVFNISLTLHLCLGLIVILFAETLGRYYIYNFLNVAPGKLGDALFVFRLSVLSVVFSVVGIPFLGLMTALEKFSIRVLIEVVSAILRLAVAILLVYYLGNKLRFYSVLNALVIVATATMYVSYCYRKHRDFVRWKFQRDRDLYKEMLSFSGWILFGACAALGKVQGAALIINLFFGTVINASFGIASQVNRLILTFSQNIGQAAIPQITKSYSSGNSDRTIQIVCYISKYTFFLMLLPALPILLETPFLLNLWLREMPEYTSIFCRLMIINALVGSLGAAIPAAVHATGKIKYFLIASSTISLSSLPAAFFLFKLGYPPYTILIVYGVAVLINVVVRQILLKKLIHFDVKKLTRVVYLKILYVVLAVAPLFAILPIWPAGAIRFITLFVVSVIWLFAAVYIVGIDKSERDIIHYRLSNLYSRFIRKDHNE